MDEEIKESYKFYEENPKVWIDIFSGDEMISDKYEHRLIYEDVCLEVKAKPEDVILAHSLV